MENELILTAGEPCCEPIQNGECDIQMNSPIICGDGKQEIVEPEMKISDEEIRHVEFTKLAKVLQDSVFHSWRLHLKAKKYSIHVILGEYYDEAFDMIDGLIEHYQGTCNCNIIDDNIIIDVIKSEDPFTYFTDLKTYLSNFVNNPNNFNEKTFEIKSDIDDLLRLIDSTLYKLGNLSESKIKSFEAFIYEDFK